jgi:murein DD-endopeptidase MepM/ murein hydrolase activator NlpD
VGAEEREGGGVKVVAAGVGAALVLFLGCFGLAPTILTSVPFATDEQRALYDEVVKERYLDIPGSVLLAVDTVRYHQDFSQVDRAAVQQTADLFAACADFQPILRRVTGRGERIPIRVPRSGEVFYGMPIRPPGAAVRFVDGQGQVYETGSSVTPGDYWLEVEAPSETAHWEIRLHLDLVGCGQQEISDVLDRLGLQGDDRAMVYHLIAMHLPEQENYGHITPGPFLWPVSDVWPITSYFGERLDPVTGEWRLHTGVDIGAPQDTPAQAATAGVVIYAARDGNYGNVVRIAHGDGVTTAYGHLRTTLVSVGQHVTKGQSIGLVGSTGKSTGPHLHFEWIEEGSFLDPLTVYQWTPEQTR